MLELITLELEVRNLGSEVRDAYQKHCEMNDVLKLQKFYNLQIFSNEVLPIDGILQLGFCALTIIDFGIHALPHTPANLEFLPFMPKLQCHSSWTFSFGPWSINK